jgi:hypothetical protein
VALSVKPALSESPRPLAGMLPYGDRTFLPPGADFSVSGERLSIRQAQFLLSRVGGLDRKRIWLETKKMSSASLLRSCILVFQGLFSIKLAFSF